MIIDGIEIKIEKKKIKNIHLAVYPPDGRVRCSVPFFLPEEKIISFLSSKLSWIKLKRKEIISKAEKNSRNFESGETHYLFGKPLQLTVTLTRDTPKIEVRDNLLDMWVFPNMQRDQRAGFLFNFYRKEMMPRIEILMEKWRPVMGEDSRPVVWKIDTMRRQWGKCYPLKRNIVLNLMLARTPIECLEYVVVHELLHLKIHGHGKDFKLAMTKLLPDWRKRKALLNSFPSLL